MTYEVELTSRLGQTGQQSTPRSTSPSSSPRRTVTRRTPARRRGADMSRADTESRVSTCPAGSASSPHLMEQRTLTSRHRAVLYAVGAGHLVGLARRRPAPRLHLPAPPS